MALIVADRLSEPGRVAMAVGRQRETTRYPGSSRWSPYSLSQGDAGLALACGYLDRCFPGQGWDVRAHEFAREAANAAEECPLPCGLFSGLAGLGLLSWWLGGEDGSRYRRFGDAVDEALAEPTAALVDVVRSGGPRGLGSGSFDLVSGLAGVGAYLLLRRTAARNEEALRAVLATLVTLVSGNPSSPWWWNPPAELHDPATAKRFPGGTLNCGLAHGLPGPLALFGLALRDGVEVPGLRDAMAEASQWLVDHRRDDEWGPNWPSMIGLPDGPTARESPGRAAWCYGSPGVAMALWLSGSALGQVAFTDTAVDAMRAVYRRPVTQRNIDSPTFCHGVAGLLQITLRFRHETGLPIFAEAAGDLTDLLLAAFDPGSALGFRHLEPPHNWLDHAGLLDGAPGVMLVLLAAVTDVEPAWDRLFLLS